MRWRVWRFDRREANDYFVALEVCIARSLTRSGVYEADGRMLAFDAEARTLFSLYRLRDEIRRQLDCDTE